MSENVYRANNNNRVKSRRKGKANNNKSPARECDGDEIPAAQTRKDHGRWAGMVCMNREVFWTHGWAKA